jgi:SAM-dependent methyltransferase
MNSTIVKPVMACNLCHDTQFRRLFFRAPYWRIRCERCGLITISEMPSQDALVTMYDAPYFSGDTYLEYAADRPVIERNAHARLRQIEKQVKVGRLLDVGCATGFFLSAARERGWDTVGVDLSRYASQYARDRFGLEVITGTLFDTAEPAGSFDVVTLWDTIEHVPDPAAVIARAAWLLKPGGLLALSTGDVESALSRILRSRWRLMTYDHLYYFSPPTLRRYFDSVGLSIIRFSKPGRWVNLRLVVHMALAGHASSPLRHLLLRLARSLPALYLNLWDVVTVHARKG